MALLMLRHRAGPESIPLSSVGQIYSQTSQDLTGRKLTPALNGTSDRSVQRRKELLAAI